MAPVKRFCRNVQNDERKQRRTTDRPQKLIEPIEFRPLPTETEPAIHRLNLGATPERPSQKGRAIQPPTGQNHGFPLASHDVNVANHHERRNCYYFPMKKLELDEAARSRGEELVLDELFDLRLYERLAAVSRGGLSEMLNRLVAVEAKHYAFWQDFFSMNRTDLDWGRRLKLAVVTVVCRVVGPSAVLLVLEGIEIYGIRKYLTLWDTYRDTPFGEALKATLMDEFEHEDEIVSGFAGRKINPERVRAIFLGFNDGLVEILGAVSGFFTVLREPRLVLGASVAVAVAGALSMAAGSFAATSSEREIERIQKGKALFLGRKKDDDQAPSPVSTGVVVGVSYFVGASLPVLPVMFGAGNALVSVLAGAVAAVVVSSILAFLSGMDVRRRIALNLAVIGLAVGVTSLIGTLVHKLWGVSL